MAYPERVFGLFERVELIMKRRGFLGLLGGAAVAGPGMVKQAAGSVGLEAMALPVLPVDYEATEHFGSAISGDPVGGKYDHADWLRGRIGDIVGMSDSARHERIASQQVSMLDPDLASSRSFSLSFKIQVQKRRNFERWQAREHRELLRELADYLNRPLQ